MFLWWKMSRLKSISIKIDLDLLEQLDKYAMKYGLNRSEAIRKAIENLVKDEVDKEKIPTARVEKIIRLRWAKMEIKISCGGAILYAFNYSEKYKIIEECEKMGLEAKVLEMKL